jgi:hypothetical protein
MSHVRTEPHNRRSLKGATMAVLKRRRWRRKAAEGYRLLVRELRSAAR